MEAPQDRPEIDPAFAEAVTARLAEIEDALQKAAVASTPFVTEAAQHIINAGGKRFRPTLVTLAAHLGRSIEEVEADRERLIWAALVMELTHVASLYHDDVMDEAELRRGAPSANARWNNTVAILVGDFLFARASSTVAQLGPEYVAVQADTFARLVQGQIAETQGGSAGEALPHYLGVLADKTGSLIAASAVFGGMIADVPADQLEALRRYGEEIGVVFQLSDDIIDITSDQTGKTPGADLREGVATLPTLMLRAARRPEDERLLGLLEADLSDDSALAETLKLLRENPVIDEARAEISRRAEVARGHLAPLPDGPAKEALSALCDQVVSRSS